MRTSPRRDTGDNFAKVRENKTPNDVYTKQTVIWLNNKFDESNSTPSLRVFSISQWKF